MKLRRNMIVSRRTMEIFEGADYLMDMETKSPGKKRVIGAKWKGNMKDGGIDEVYATFLDHFVELSEDKFVEEDEDDDPTYMKFLNNLKEHGNAYMLDVSMEHGVSVPIKYEVEDDTLDELKRKTSKSSRCSLIQESRSLVIDGALGSGPKRFGFLKETTLSCRRSSLFVDEKMDSRLKYPCSGKQNTERCSPKIQEESYAQRKSSVRKPSQEVDCSSDQNCRSNLRAVTEDEVYKVFLNCLKVVGQSVFYECGVGKRVYYEMSDPERSIDVEIHPSKTAPTPQNLTPRPRTPPPPRPRTPAPRQPTPTPRQTIAPQRQRTPLPTAKDHRSMLSASMLKNNGKASKKEHSWFWKDLKSIVRKPYEQDEYDDLLQKVNARTPVEVHRETRSGGYQTVPGNMGKSYLDTYRDLQCEIEKVKFDRPKVLNLLRGFFLYLKCVPHGVPRPWTNDSGKRIILGSL